MPTPTTPRNTDAPGSGGPAFPCAVDHTRAGEPRNQFYGMTLRDYFAAYAMQVEIATASYSIENAKALVGAAEKARLTIEQQIAHNAYSMADAMLIARSQAA